MIYHIYWGTAGNAGLYLDEIYKTLQSEGFEQEVFVSHYYPFDYGHKVFFKLTELGHCNKLGKLRNPIRYLELIYALTVVYIHILIHKPKIVNYSFIGVFTPVLLFLRLVKKTTKSKLILTCHDVMPFANTIQTLTRQEKMRKKAFQMADFLLTHNQSSAEELHHSFGIPTHKILRHCFPIMDLNTLFQHGSPGTKKYDFLFLGHLRKEKGVEVLIEAWKMFHDNHPNGRLCIAGYAPFGFDTSPYQGMNIDFIIQFLSDKQYHSLASSTKCIVLPYTKGTNSGVVSTLATLGVCVITSDLEMFQSNPLLNKELMFESENPLSLFKKMDMVYQEGFEKSDTMDMLGKYKSSFRKEIVEVYNKLCNPT